MCKIKLYILCIILVLSHLFKLLYVCITKIMEIEMNFGIQLKMLLLLTCLIVDSISKNGIWYG